MDIHFDIESSSIKHEAGSFYFFVPQVVLHSLYVYFIELCNVCLLFDSYDHPQIFVKCICLVL